VTTAESWVKRLAPGTLLYNKNHQGFYLVVHASARDFPEKWLELSILLVTPQCTLKRLQVESGIFTGNWVIVDVS